MPDASGYPEGYSVASHHPEPVWAACNEDAPCVVAGRLAMEQADRLRCLLDRYPTDWPVSAALIEQMTVRLEDVVEEFAHVLGEPRELVNGWLVEPATAARMRARRAVA